MKLSEKLPMDIMSTLKLFPAPSRSSASSNTSGRYLVDMSSLGEVPDVRS